MFRSSASRSLPGSLLLAALPLLLAPATAVHAGVPDPVNSGYVFPASLPFCPEPVSVLVTVRDGFGAPEAACSTWVVVVLESGMLDPGQTTRTGGRTTPDGVITVTFAGGIGGQGTIHLDVFANEGGSGDIHLTSSDAFVIPGSCGAATDAPHAGPGAQGWVNGLTGTFPNPFRAATTVSFTVGQPSAVRLTVHDVTGRLVATLVDGDRRAGSDRVSWDGLDRTGRPVAAGLYFCRLVVGAWSETRAVLRVR
ncbi:MAG TPA: FlgD immunoglobulin-like domain containing protein [bacterium]|nr:FlgD immunoglobulin-like domain containing protein [bacterium]